MLLSDTACFHLYKTHDSSTHNNNNVIIMCFTFFNYLCEWQIFMFTQNKYDHYEYCSCEILLLIFWEIVISLNYKIEMLWVADSKYKLKNSVVR